MVIFFSPCSLDLHSIRALLFRWSFAVVDLTIVAAVPSHAASAATATANRIAHPHAYTTTQHYVIARTHNLDPPSLLLSLDHPFTMATCRSINDSFVLLGVVGVALLVVTLVQATLRQGDPLKQLGTNT
jgi:hypothetical protein